MSIFFNIFFIVFTLKNTFSSSYFLLLSNVQSLVLHLNRFIITKIIAASWFMTDYLWELDNIQLDSGETLIERNTIIPKPNPSFTDSTSIFHGPFNGGLQLFEVEFEKKIIYPYSSTANMSSDPCYEMNNALERKEKAIHDAQQRRIAAGLPPIKSKSKKSKSKPAESGPMDSFIAKFPRSKSNTQNTVEKSNETTDNVQRCDQCEKAINSAELDGIRDTFDHCDLNDKKNATKLVHRINNICLCNNDLKTHISREFFYRTDGKENEMAAEVYDIWDTIIDSNMDENSDDDIKSDIDTSLTSNNNNMDVLNENTPQKKVFRKRKLELDDENDIQEPSPKRQKISDPIEFEPDDLDDIISQCDEIPGQPQNENEEPDEIPGQPQNENEQKNPYDSIEDPEERALIMAADKQIREERIERQRKNDEFQRELDRYIDEQENEPEIEQEIEEIPENQDSPRSQRNRDESRSSSRSRSKSRRNRDESRSPSRSRSRSRSRDKRRNKNKRGNRKNGDDRYNKDNPNISQKFIRFQIYDRKATINNMNFKHVVYWEADYGFDGVLKGFGELRKTNIRHNAFRNKIFLTKADYEIFAYPKCEQTAEYYDSDFKDGKQNLVDHGDTSLKKPKESAQSKDIAIMDLIDDLILNKGYFHFPKFQSDYPRIAIVGKYAKYFRNQLDSKTFRDVAQKESNFAEKCQKENWYDPAEEKLKNQDRRQITWIFGQSGNEGKSKFAKYLKAKNQFKTLFVAGAKTAKHIAYAAESHHNLFIFDLPRGCHMGLDTLGLIESIKDGEIMADHYETKLKVFTDPKVVIFANEPPSLCQWSKDRYDIYEIINNELQRFDPNA